MNPFHNFFHSPHPRGGHHHHGHQGGPRCADKHLGRHGGRGAFGAAGGFSGGPGHGLAGFERGRKLGADDLQLLILALLAERPRHGYELIKEIDQRSQGYYVPSPGMIYPSLSYLEEVGYASVQAEGAKKLYTISAPGQAHLDEHRAAVDAMLAQLSLFGERMARLREQVGSEAGGPSAPLDGERAGRGGRRDGWPGPLGAAVEGLKAALRERRSGSATELQRVCDILVRAAAEIRQG